MTEGTRTMTKPSPLTAHWDWQLSARCRYTGSDLFFARENEGLGERLRRERDAKEVCSQCPVRQRCSDHALTFAEPFGVWGGTTESDRRFQRASPSTDTPRMTGRPSVQLRVSPTHPRPGMKERRMPAAVLP
ncbi:WhiB family transcriptional regulator [Rhodococcus sp. WS4]|nr:WhiB family transcriptional regulator [Rhodococcus sp. WS4]